MTVPGHGSDFVPSLVGFAFTILSARSSGPEEDSARLKSDPASWNRLPALFKRQHPDATATVQPGRHNRVEWKRFWTLDPNRRHEGLSARRSIMQFPGSGDRGTGYPGSLGCPHLNPNAKPAHNTGAMFYAGRGYGAWAVDLHKNQTAQRLHTSSLTDPAEARILRSFESGHTNTGQIDQFASDLNTQAEPVLMDSQAKYAVLAAGGAEVLLRLLSASQPNYHEKIWDQAAGSIVLEERWRISDLDASRWTSQLGLLLNNAASCLNGSTSPRQPWNIRKIGA